MAVKRIVDTSFWNDDKVIELFSPEDKLFMLYILTNPHTTQLGIYKINKKIMAFELGYSIETISVLLDRFETKYNIIIYCNETNEIAIKNYLKYSIIKGGKPVEDCLLKEIRQVKNKKLISYVFNNIKNDTNINETVNKIINEYKNDNDNDNEVSYHDSYHDSSETKKKEKYGTYGRVKLTIDEYLRLINEFGEDFIKKQIELLDEYIESNNNKNKYTNFNLVLRKSIRENWFNKKQEDIPEWFDKKNKKEEITEEEQNEMEELLKEIGE